MVFLVTNGYQRILTNGYGRSLDTRQKRRRHQVCERKGRCYSDQEIPTASIWSVDGSGEEKVFRRIFSGGVWRHRLPQSQTSTCETQCVRRFGTGIQSPFQMASSDTTSTSGWQLPIPMYTYVYVYVYIYIQISYIHIYVYIFTHVNFLTKSKRTRKEKKQAVTQTWRSQVTVSGQGFQTTNRSGQVSGQGFQKQHRSGQVSGQGVPETWDLTWDLTGEDRCEVFSSLNFLVVKLCLPPIPPQTARRLSQITDTEFKK
jgi:hypothetical protein